MQFSALEAVLAHYADAYSPASSYLLEILHETQDIYGGWLPRPALADFYAPLTNHLVKATMSFGLTGIAITDRSTIDLIHRAEPEARKQALAPAVKEAIAAYESARKGAPAASGPVRKLVIAVPVPSNSCSRMASSTSLK